MAEAGVGAIARASGTGQSYLAMDMAGAVLLGTEFAGHEIKKTRADVLCARSGDASGMCRRAARRGWQAKAKPAFDHDGQDEHEVPFAHVIPGAEADRARRASRKSASPCQSLQG